MLTFINENMPNSTCVQWSMGLSRTDENYVPAHKAGRLTGKLAAFAVIWLSKVRLYRYIVVKRCARCALRVGRIKFSVSRYIFMTRQSLVCGLGGNNIVCFYAKYENPKAH